MLDGVIQTKAGALVTIADVVCGDFEVALAHELILDVVLDVFDVDEGLVTSADVGGDGLGDGVCGAGVFFESQEGS